MANITLESLKKKRKYVPPRILLYAANRLGKSTALATAPNSVQIVTEPLSDDEILAGNAFPRCQTYGDVVDAVSWLMSEEHDFTCLTIDSADWVEKLIKDQICQERGWANLESVKFNKEGHLLVLAEWQQLLDALDVLRLQRGMMIVFCAKEAYRNATDTFGGTYPQSVPALSEGDRSMREHNPLKLMVDWCDIVGLIRHNIEIRKDENAVGKQNKANVLGGDCRRKLHLEEHPSYMGGNRYGLKDMPFDNPFDWERLINAVKGTF